MERRQLTAERVRELFEYRDGKLYWKVRVSSRAAIGQEAGTPDKDGYRVICFEGRLYKRHRLVWLMHHGRWPVHLIDHVNGTPGDDRIENLREANDQENAFNRRARGYSLKKGTGRWQAYIKKDGKMRHLGYYDDEAEARAAYLAAKGELHMFSEVA